MLQRTLPDITSDIAADKPATIQWVGMDNIAVPLTLESTHSVSQIITAKANVYVSLDDPNAKGIHMSRLYALVNKQPALPCTRAHLKKLLTQIIHSQQSISNQAKIELHFDLLLAKPALLSDQQGYQAYPVKITAQKLAHGPDFQIALTIPYSSTCPCSASLSRQLYAEAINCTFEGTHIDKTSLLAWIESSAGSVATPHSQRSYAYITLTLNDGPWPDLAELIFTLENVIATPVQTAVKRVDEQEFARLNATNLMFCEDAARRLKSNLEKQPFVKQYWCKVEHQESLHAHNAVAMVSGFCN
ncbi:GTP cyclohydrolase FolE2 [Aestuariibacter sp. A3R04]|uniref:GTP cyclohydrolase FolE2 n=1 Tax=Aestuariibacter sp. A3R04 TaxID=2841571 RepID=UPI001C082A73|nr:GTP cyclohydrolase FolE2 [Aestuariibacter sp. A3R04]MBU3021299.1 GTP cyclohydrolase I FolE2 [Aestuariibacter sp. A3R04]